MALFALILFTVGTGPFVPRLANAQYQCGSDQDSTAASSQQFTLQRNVLGQPIHLKVIYVGFSDTQPSDMQLTSQMLVGLPSGLEQVLERQSRGQIDATIEVLTRSDAPGDAWQVSLAHDEYYSDPSICDPPAAGACDLDCNREYQSEVVELVYQDYTASGRANPFASGDYFVVVPRDYPHPSFGGSSVLSVKTTGGCHPYVGPGQTIDGRLKGFWGVWGPGASFETAAMIVYHELGHQFDLRDSYDGLQGDRPIEDVFGWGNYNGMRGFYIRDEGFVPYLTHDLVELGWYSEPTLVSSSLKGVRLDDLRDPSLGGETLKIPLPSFSWIDDSSPFFGDVPVESEQYFLVAYHGHQAGSEDAALNTQGQTIYRSRGVAIWHTTRSTVGAGHPFLTEGIKWRIGDSELLELASGRWDEPFAQTTPDPTSGATKLTGFAGRSIQSLIDYHGDSDDLYMSVDGRREFSYRSNPNTFGVEQVRVSAPSVTENSIFIEVIEDNGDHVILDVLLAPHEDLLFPNDESHYVVAGWPTTVRWTMDRSYGWDGVMPYDPSNDLVVETVDIEVATDGGTSGVWSTVATGVPNTGEYAWTPDSALVGTNTVLRLTFNNNLSSSSEFGQDESDMPFTIVASPAARAENKSSDTGLAYPGMPYSSITLDADGDADQDLMIANQTALSNMYENSGVIGGVPQFEEYESTRWEDGNAVPQQALHGLTAADYDNDGDVDFFAGADIDSRLYRNDGSGNFDDVAMEMGLGGDIAWYSWCGAWQDYDGDGFLDLFIGRGIITATEPTISGYEKPNRLLRAVVDDQQRVTGYTDVATTAGIVAPELEDDFTSSAAWADYDADGDADLYVGRLMDGPPQGSHLFVNQGDGTFVEQMVNLASGDMSYNSSGSWVDIDGDADLDLVGSCQANSGFIGTRVFLQNSGELTLVSEGIHLGERHSVKDVRAMDFDLDGAMDLISIPESSSSVPRLYLRAIEVPALAMYEAGAIVGFDADATSGVALEDWNGDGDIDVYLGRQANVQDKKFFYRNAQVGGVDSPTNKWAGVELVGGAGNNVSAIGATVVLKKGGVPSQVAVVDGGSGRGGQASRVLRFGLGEYVGSPTLSVDVTWPNGVTQSATLTEGSITQVLDATPATVTPGSVSFSYTPQMNGENTWKFVWITQHLTRISKDRVSVSQTSGGSGWWSLDKADGNVTVRVTKVAGGYRHELTATNMTCVVMGSYNYTVRSETDFQSATGAQKSFTTKICAVSF